MKTTKLIMNMLARQDLVYVAAVTRAHTHTMHATRTLHTSTLHTHTTHTHTHTHTKDGEQDINNNHCSYYSTLFSSLSCGTLGLNSKLLIGYSASRGGWLCLVAGGRAQEQDR